jgi:hypothetical protein
MTPQACRPTMRTLLTLKSDYPRQHISPNEAFVMMVSAE